MLSVIIPTHNRSSILSRCLDSLSKQTNAGEFEVIVVDDGSTDDTFDLCRRLRAGFSTPLRYCFQPQGGPSLARNLGISQAEGDLLLMIGDDIIPATNDFLSQHVNWHQSLYPEANLAVLGKVTWPPDYAISPYMHWLETGPQFAFHKLKHGSIVSFEYFYTSNISVKKSFLGDERFDETFRYAAYEDIEFGYRLAAKGLRIVYNDIAIGYHHHHITLRSYLNRAFVAGRSRALFDRLHPEISLIISVNRNRQMLFSLICNSMTRRFWERLGLILETRISAGLLWYMLYRYHFLRGYAFEVRGS